MIEIIYHGRIGNQLFQYCLGRILAERLGYCLKADAINGFPETSKPVAGADHFDGISEIVRDQPEITIEQILRRGASRKIVLAGYFQQYHLYKNYKEKIRTQWLRMQSVPDFEPGPQDILVMVRRADFLFYDSLLPFSFYEEALNKVGGGKVYLSTDDPDDPFIRNFSKYNPVILPSNVLANFRQAMAFKKLILSMSTFSWWAAYLSKAEQIVMPDPLEGFWNREASPLIDLKVDDEGRYIHLKCREKYKKNVPETLRYMNFRFRRKCSPVKQAILKSLNTKKAA